MDAAHDSRPRRQPPIRSRLYSAAGNHGTAQADGLPAPSGDKMLAVPDRESFGGLTIRTALLLGFGLTFGVWLFAGYYFTQRVREVERRAGTINERYMRAQEVLSTVRAQVLLGSVYVRDALLDPDPSATPGYRAQLENTYRAVDQVLAQYVPVMDSVEERARVAHLRNAVSEFRVTMLEVIADDNSRWPADARVLLRTRIVPKREVVIQVSEDVQALNRGAFVQQQRAVAEIYGATQRRLWESLGLALAASFGIALFATRYAGRLERRLRRQQQQEAQTNDELQRLSAKLIVAQEEERRSIARELHDEVGQVLTAIKVELAVAQRALDANGTAPRVLEDARSITEGALATVRDLSHLLHPALLDDLGLPSAVEWYLRGFGARHEISAELLHDRMDERFTPDVEASVYRIVQEALTNVAKHARATTCRVYLQRLPHTILITVEDNGAGFDAAASGAQAPRAGIGLVGIRERAAQLRGTVRLESAPGKGTRLTVELPARVRATADDARGDDTPGAAAPSPQLVPDA
jgi:signal transduction histidine kinase